MLDVKVLLCGCGEVGDLCGGVKTAGGLGIEAFLRGW